MVGGSAIAQTIDHSLGDDGQRGLRMTPQRIMIVGHCGVQHITHATRIDEYSESWHTFFSGSPNSMLSGCVALSICYAPIILHSPMLWSCIRLGSDMPCAKLGTDRGVINGSVCGGQNAVSGTKRGMGGSRTFAFSTVCIFLANASGSTAAPQTTVPEQTPDMCIRHGHKMKQTYLLRPATAQ